MNAINKNTFRHRYLSIVKNFKFLPEKKYVAILYECYTAKKLNLKNPKTFNEKIQWYKIYYKNPLFTKLVDKYRVREYVKEKVGEKYLNDLLQVYNHFSEINFDELPQQFVIKGVHGCGFNLIVKDKSKLDIKKAVSAIKKWQKINYYKKGMEWAYKNIPKTIIAEKYLEEHGKPVINDYKFFCFNGEIKFIQVDIDRGINYYRCFYNTRWIKQSFCTHKNKFFDGEVEKPSNLDDMLFVSKQLSANIPFVRVDLYAINGKTIFGEMTFYPANGVKLFIPDEMNEIIGDYFMLPEKIIEN